MSLSFLVKATFLVSSGREWSNESNRPDLTVLPNGSFGTGLARPLFAAPCLENGVKLKE